MHNRYIFGDDDEKIDKVSARLSFAPKYYREVAENARIRLFFMYYKARSIILGSRNVL